MPRQTAVALSIPESDYTIKNQLLKDANVRRWHLNKFKRSPGVAEVDIRRLAYFCRLAKLSRSKFASLPIVKMENLAMDFIDHMETTKNPETNKPYAPTYILAQLKVIKSWSAWNRKMSQRTINVSNREISIKITTIHQAS